MIPANTKKSSYRGNWEIAEAERAECQRARYAPCQHGEIGLHRAPTEPPSTSGARAHGLGDSAGSVDRVVQ